MANALRITRAEAKQIALEDLAAHDWFRFVLSFPPHLIEARRIEMGKTLGFERQYARVTRLYFGGMARHLSEMRPIPRPGVPLA